MTDLVTDSNSDSESESERNKRGGGRFTQDIWMNLGWFKFSKLFKHARDFTETYVAFGIPTSVSLSSLFLLQKKQQVGLGSWDFIFGKEISLAHHQGGKK